MKVLSKYIGKEFLKLFTLCLIIFVTLFLIIDFVQKVDNLVEAGVSFETSFRYFIYKIPFILLQMMPVATLISVILLFNLMKKNNEIMALKTHGINLFSAFTTCVFISLAISFAAFLFAEAVVPYTSSKSNKIWNLDVEKQNPASFFGGGQIRYKSEKAIYWIQNFDSADRIMENPVFYFFDDDFNLEKRIDGTRGVWENSVWKIEDGVIQKRNSNGEYELERFETVLLDIPETPDTFIRGEKNPEDMSFSQLKHFSEKVGLEGYDNTRYIVDMNIKLAFPLVSLIMTIIGIPIALGLEKGSAPLAVAVGVGVCFLYMIFLSFSRSLGLSGVFPPFFSAWAANIIFIFLGLFLMLSLER